MILASIVSTLNKIINKFMSVLFVLNGKNMGASVMWHRRFCTGQFPMGKRIYKCPINTWYRGFK